MPLYDKLLIGFSYRMSNAIIEKKSILNIVPKD